MKARACDLRGNFNHISTNRRHILASARRSQQHDCLAHVATRAVAELPERLISRDATPACPLTREVSAGRSDSMRLLRRLAKPKSQHARQFLDSATARTAA